jgi:hypothetical protein
LLTNPQRISLHWQPYGNRDNQSPGNRLDYGPQT